MTPPLYAAVLAGGASRRMGVDKRFLEYEGEALVDRAVALARRLTHNHHGEVFLCGEVPGRASLPDERADLGPLAGLHTGITHARRRSPTLAPWLIVLPVDMPRLDAEVIELLVAASRPSAEAPSRAYSFDGFMLPLLLRCDEVTLATLDALSEQPSPGARSIRALERQLHAAALPPPPHLLPKLHNANSPEDWRALTHREVL